MTLFDFKSLTALAVCSFALTLAQGQELFPLVSETDAVTDDVKVTPPELDFLRVKPSASITIRWLLFQVGDRSSNTGQLTCLNWTRSINLSKALEAEGPFHAAVVPLSEYQAGPSGSFWNNSGEAFMTPLASKWDIPVWSLSPADSPKLTLSALYRASKKSKGSATIAVAWDGAELSNLQRSWFDGLAQSKELNGVQALSWKQKIQDWSSADQQRIDILEYTINNGIIIGVDWRSKKINIPRTSFGCAES